MKNKSHSTATPTDSTFPNEDHLGLERLVFFSDAVFAIAITLLALEIRLPELEGSVSNEELWQALINIGPKYLAYIISFFVIGSFWLAHHRKFRFIKRYDRRLLTLNLLLLLFVGFIPFPTSIISEYENQTATMFYAAFMGITGLVSYSMWRYAAYHNRLIDPDLSPAFHRQMNYNSLLAPLVFLVSIFISLINPDLAKLSWLIIGIAPVIMH